MCVCPCLILLHVSCSKDKEPNNTNKWSIRRRTEQRRKTTTLGHNSSIVLGRMFTSARWRHQLIWAITKAELVSSRRRHSLDTFRLNAGCKVRVCWPFFSCWQKHETLFPVRARQPANLTGCRRCFWGDTSPKGGRFLKNNRLIYGNVLFVPEMERVRDLSAVNNHAMLSSLRDSYAGQSYHCK